MGRVCPQRFEDRAECPTCGLKMAFLPPGAWQCPFHGFAWVQRLKAWWREEPLIVDRELGRQLLQRWFGGNR